MRVLFLTHRLPYAPNRGDRIRAYHLIRTLARTDDVFVVSLVHDAEEAGHVPDVAKLCAGAEGASVPARRNRVRALAALAGSTPLTHVLLDSPRMPAILDRVTAEWKPDVVLAYCSGMARYALAAPLAGRPFVLDMVDVDSEKWRALSEKSPIQKRWIYRREWRLMRGFERHAAVAARATLVVSERERIAMREIAPDARTLLIPNGVDVAGFTPRQPPVPSKTIAFCGVFNYAPNEEGAVWLARRVWPDVLREEPEARLMLVGMNPSAAVRGLAQDPSISVTGAVPDVRPYLWSAAASVAPLFVARGLQNKVLEALAAGLPCVITPAVMDGLPVEARGGCIAAGDPSEFARGILRLLALAPSERRAFAGRSDLAALTWDRQLQDVPAIVASAREAAAPAPQAAQGGH